MARLLACQSTNRERLEGRVAGATNARVTPSIGHGIEPLQLMMNAEELPTVEFADHTFVFH